MFDINKKSALHKSRLHPIATFKDRDEWIRMFLAVDGDTLSAGAKIVGTCISLHHNVETGQCDPPIRALVSGTGMSESTVYRMLLELEASGWISPNRTGGRHRNSYELRAPTLSGVTGFNPVNCDRVQEASTLSTVTPQPCQGRQGNPVTADTPNDKRIDKRKDKRRRDSPQLDLGDEEGRRCPNPNSQTQTDDAFESWYAAYPKREDKQDALRAYRLVIKKKLATPEQLLAAAMQYAAEQSGKDPQYIKSPANWLRKGSYANEPASTGAAYTAPAPGHSHHIEVAAQIARQIQAEQEGRNV
jgi:hypothetical protein